MLRLRPLPVADEGSNKKSVAVKICRRSKAQQILGTALRICFVATHNQLCHLLQSRKVTAEAIFESGAFIRNADWFSISIFLTVS